MESLPNEVIISIAQSLSDIMSLGRWSQTNHHYCAVLTDNLIWQSQFKRDFPTVLINHTIPSWRELYRQQIDAKQQFYREFPDFSRVGDWVMPRFSKGWVDVYNQALINPILLQPAINRIDHEIKSRISTAKLTFKTRFPYNSRMKFPVTQRYLLNLGKSSKVSILRGNVISFIITISAKVPAIRLRQRIFRLQDYFGDHFRLIVGIHDDDHTLCFDGSLIEQSNGAHIWFPLVGTQWIDHQQMTHVDTEFGQNWSKMRVED